MHRMKSFVPEPVPGRDRSGLMNPRSAVKFMTIGSSKINPITTVNSEEQLEGTRGRRRIQVGARSLGPERRSCIAREE